MVYWGSFAPFHAGHRETLCIAYDTLRSAAEGYDVLGAIVLPLRNLTPRGKSHESDALRPWQRRCTITALSLLGLPWARCAMPPFPHPVLALREALRRDPSTDDIAVMWLNGTDIPHAGVVQHVAEAADAHCVFVPRVGGRACTSFTSSPRVHITPCAQLAFSSSKVRECFARSAFEEIEGMMCNPASAAYYLRCERN